MENWNRIEVLRRSVRNWVGLVALAVVLSALTAGVILACPAMAPTAKPVPAFEKMKSLVGEWQGKAADGTGAKVSYALVSDNSALMERLAMGSESEMVTIYYPDGDRLMMTHYCSAHNQPRMRSQSGSAETKSIAFDFVDATNLASPDAGHMAKLVLTFADQDHLTQEWTWHEKGKEGVVVIQFERKK